MQGFIILATISSVLMVARMMKACIVVALTGIFFGVLRGPNSAPFPMGFR